MKVEALLIGSALVLLVHLFAGISVFIAYWCIISWDFSESIFALGNLLRLLYLGSFLLLVKGKV